MVLEQPFSFLYQLVFRHLLKTILNEEQVPNKFCLWISIEIEMTHNFFFLYAILETALKQNHNYDLHIKTGLPLLGL